MSDDIPERLAEFRKSIDNLDASLIYLLAERFHLTEQVGEFKKSRDLPPSDTTREAEQIARLRELATESNLDPDFAERVIRFIIDEVVRNHERIRSRG
ncbi:MAG: chorismate mutase [Hyphomicrobiales bacterium]